MPYEYMDLMENLVESMLSVGGIGSMLGVVSYVFCGLSLYTIARRRCIKKPWLAWVPVVNVWILGSISDQYRYVVKGEVKNKRKVLLIVNLLKCSLSLVVYAQVVATVIGVANRMLHGAGDDALMPMLLSGLGKGMLLSIPSLIVSIVGLVFEIMALYDVYTSCEPENNVLYLILSIVPGVSQITKPLFLFLCREQDRGMPPRRDDPEVL